MSGGGRLGGRHLGGRARRRLIRVAGCALLAVVLAGLAGWLQPQGRFARFEAVASDLVFPRGAADPDVVVVAVDPRSVAEVGQGWPWARTTHASLVERLAALEPSVIVLDLLLLAAGDEDGDAALAAAMASAGNVVLAASALPAGTQDTGVPVAPTVVRPPDTFSHAAAALAHPQVSPEPVDGVVRSVPLVIEGPDRRLLPSLALAALALDTGAQVEPVLRTPSGVQVGQRTIPTDGSYRLRVSFAPELSDEDSPRVVPAAAVVDGSADPELLRGAVVFVGITDPTLGDRHITPVAKGAGLPGVLVHANAYSTITTRSYLTPASRTEVVVTVLAVALLCAMAVQFLPTPAAAAAWAAALVAVLLFGYVRADSGTIASFVYPALAAGLALPGSGAIRYSVEARQQRRVNRLFASYVPEPVARQLIDEGLVEQASTGQRSEISVLFCDLRGFTAMSARHEPAEVNELLSDYYEFASEIVLSHGGTLMQYVGDEVFAVFGAPVPEPDHAARALATAVELQEQVDRLDAAVGARGAEPLRFGIGVNAGVVVAVHAGSTWRRQYTVIGDTVNVGSRLCSQAGVGQVVISEAVRAAIEPPPPVEPLGQREMKGVREDFQAWKVVLDRPPSGTADRA